MPYEGEASRYIATSRIAESAKVKGFLERCVVAPHEISVSNSLGQLIQVSTPEPENLPRFVIAIDGSYVPIPVRNGFPGAEIGFVSMAAVLLDLQRIADLSKQRFPNPSEVEDTTSTDADEFALPGSNVQFSNGLDPAESFRRQLHDALSERRSTTDGESLLDTFHDLLQYKGQDHSERCPYEDCARADARFERDIGTYTCPCELERPLYSTDALRIHEAFAPTRSSREAYGETMQVVERLTLVNLLRSIEQRGWLDSLDRIAFMLDGPLAVFGHPAWLKDGIQRELVRINSRVRSVTGRDLLILGVEKTGRFMEHFLQLDTTTQGAPGNVEAGTALLLTDQYIKQCIILSKSDRPYGFQTYFGRKFLYKTQSGAHVVGVTPYLNDRQADLSSAQPDQFARLPDALALLDSLVSARYPDAMVPIIEAHANATIARGVGIQILEKLARELLNDNS